MRHGFKGEGLDHKKHHAHQYRNGRQLRAFLAKKDHGHAKNDRRRDHVDKMHPKDQGRHRSHRIVDRSDDSRCRHEKQRQTGRYTISFDIKDRPLHTFALSVFLISVYHPRQKMSSEDFIWLYSAYSRS